MKTSHRLMLVLLLCLAFMAAGCGGGGGQDGGGETPAGDEGGAGEAPDDEGGPTPAVGAAVDTCTTSADCEEKSVCHYGGICKTYEEVGIHSELTTEEDCNAAGAGYEFIGVEYRGPNSCLATCVDMDTFFADIPMEESACEPFGGVWIYIPDYDASYCVTEDISSCVSLAGEGEGGGEGGGGGEEGDTTLPTVATISPKAGDNGVAINSQISVTFSEAMNTSSVDEAFSLSDDAGNIIKCTPNWDGNNVTFIPSANLAYFTEYTVTIGTGAKDTSGNPLEDTADSEAAFSSVFFTTANLFLMLDGEGDRATGDGTVFPAGTASSFTVEAWVYPTAGDIMYIASDDAYDLIVDIPHNMVFFKLWRSNCTSTGYYISGNAINGIAADEWNHIAVSYYVSGTPPNLIKVAINGELQSIPAPEITGDLCNNPNYNLSIGDLYAGSVNGFSGVIDEVRISDIAGYDGNFDPAETFYPDAHTMGLWHFDETAGSTAFSDASGNDSTLAAAGNAHTDFSGGGTASTPKACITSEECEADEVCYFDSTCKPHASVGVLDTATYPDEPTCVAANPGQYYWISIVYQSGLCNQFCVNTDVFWDPDNGAQNSEDTCTRPNAWITEKGTPGQPGYIPGHCATSDMMQCGDGSE